MFKIQATKGQKFVRTSAKAEIKVPVSVGTDADRVVIRLARFAPHAIVRPRVIVAVRVHNRVHVPVVEVTQ